MGTFAKPQRPQREAKTQRENENRGPTDFNRKSERRPPVSSIILLVRLATVFAAISNPSSHVCVFFY